MIWALRHSERTDLDDKELFIKHKKRFISTDPNLTPNGLKIASETGTFLLNQITSQYPDKKIQVVSSPYQRCIQTSIQIMKEFPKEKLYSNTLHLEDGFQELYCPMNAGLSEDTPEKQVYKQILKGNMDLKNEFFGDFDHAHNTLLDNTRTYPYLPKWGEKVLENVNRFTLRMEELAQLNSKPEFKDVIFVVICHGIQRKVAEEISSKSHAGGYCCIFNFNIEQKKDINNTEKPSFDWKLINGEQYAYDISHNKPLKFFYVRHSVRCDKNDKPNHKKHVERGLEHRDTPQTQFGKDIAKQTGQYLKEELLSGKFPGKKKFLVISSPYHRCLQTSKSIIDGFGRDLLHEDNLFVEETFEEYYSETAHVRKEVRWTRSFNRLEYDQDLKHELLEDISYTKNVLFNYALETGPIGVLKWPESYKYMVSRFNFRFQEMQRIMTKSAEYDDVMVIIVAHGCLRDMLEVFQKQKLETTKYCAVNLLRVQGHSIDLLSYNQTCYDESKIVEVDIDDALDDKPGAAKTNDQPKIEEMKKKSCPMHRMGTYLGLGLLASFVFYGFYKRN